MKRRIRLQIDGQEAWVASGSRVLDAADDHPELALLVNCRAAHCGSCHVRLCSDPAGVLPPAADERETLSALGYREGRLGCQLVVSGETGAVILESIPSRKLMNDPG